MNDKYILDERGRVVREDDLFKWARWFEDSIEQRRVARTRVGRYLVSTVFLGIDHSWGAGNPILWETMVFSLPKSPEEELDICHYREAEMRRCSGNREQAEAQHADVVALLQKEVGAKVP
jgi:hypothetical protein